MEIKEFARKVCNAIERELGEAYHVEIKEVKKNNGIVLHGILILSEKKNVVPTIYLETFLEAYEMGTTFGEIVRRLVDIYRKDTPDGMVDMAFFRSFEEVKDRICYRLVGRKGNEVLLQEIPHIEFLDLVLCFYYAYQGESLGEGSILIYNSHQEMWKTCTAELLRLAQSNTPRLFPWKCYSLEDVYRETQEEITCDGNVPEELSMQILSNAKRVQGAVCMLYPGVLEKIATKLQSSLYILPSSVHEVLLLADIGMSRAEELKKMVVEVNNTQVAPEEVLSDSLYYYDFFEKKVKLIF